MRTISQRAFLPLLLFFATSICAQVAVTNTGVLYITGSSDIFYSTGDFTNNSTSSLTNGGQLYVKGNLSNAQASMATGTGTLYLNGTVAQSIDGTQPFKTFNFVSNNTVGIVINNNLHVSGTHTFTNGVITTSATPNYLVYEAGSSYAGDDDSRHVNGWIKKMGSTAFIFPVGNGSVERTIYLSGLSANSEFNVRYYPTTPNYTSMVSPVWSVDRPEYWAVNRVSGGTALLTLNWNNSKVFFPNWIVPDILVTRYNGTAWVDAGGAGTATGNAATTGVVTSNAVSSFSLFTFGSRSYILPLTLVQFTAATEGSSTLINWITEHEINTDHFTLERSDDGNLFYAINSIAARNSNSRESYSFRDMASTGSVAYYRLRWNDLSGAEKFSSIVTVRRSADAPEIFVLKNPVSDQVPLMIRDLKGPIAYFIHSTNGQQMSKGSIDVTADGQYVIPVGNIRAGTYLLVIASKQGQYSFKIVVE